MPNKSDKTRESHELNVPVLCPNASPTRAGSPRVYSIFIRGPLAAGKTTIANVLASKLNTQVISVDLILDEHGLEEWEDHADGTYCITEKSFLRANDHVLEAAHKIHASGRPSIVDGNFYWRSAVDDLRSRMGVPCHVFTLKVPLSKCVERNKARKHPVGDDGDVKMVFDRVSSFDAGTPVDATGTVDVTVEIILAYLR